MKKRNCVILITFILLLLFLFVYSYALYTKNQRADLRAQYKQEAEIYLSEKYREEMIVRDDVILGDIRVVTAYLKSNPAIEFPVWGGGKTMGDKYLQEHLRFDAQQRFTAILQQYFPNEFSMEVDGIVWENPDSSGELETNYYLYELYRKLGRPPTWDEVGNNVRLGGITISIETVIGNDEQRANLRQRFEETGCHVHRIDVTSKKRGQEDYTFPF